VADEVVLAATQEHVAGVVDEGAGGAAVSVRAPDLPGVAGGRLGPDDVVVDGGDGGELGVFSGFQAGQIAPGSVFDYEAEVGAVVGGEGAYGGVGVEEVEWGGVEVGEVSAACAGPGGGRVRLAGCRGGGGVAAEQ
jgi:hypothetical protein